MRTKHVAFFMVFLAVIFSEFGILASSTKTYGKVLLGAYYFDGWNSTSPHITPALKKTFFVREPKWGWVTSQQNVMDQQIIEASNAGLGFFSFCWYANNQRDSLNNALELYHKSNYKKRLKFCLLVANHEGFFITPKNWELSTDQWISHFSTNEYLEVDGKPLIIFFSIDNLINKFGSAQAVKDALESFRQKAKKNGLRGLSIAVCVTARGTTLKLSEQCGFDIVTGYNHHSLGFHGESQQVPIASMQSSEYKMWDNLSRWSKLPYMPVSTLNWDPRPWANVRNGYNEAQYYVGYSSNSVYKSVSQIVKWLNNDANNTTTEKIGLLYAWNENGEGAYLTPSKNGDNMLNGVKKALKIPTSHTNKP